MVACSFYGHRCAGGMAHLVEVKRDKCKRRAALADLGSGQEHLCARRWWACLFCPCRAWLNLQWMGPEHERIFLSNSLRHTQRRSHVSALWRMWTSSTCWRRRVLRASYTGSGCAMPDSGTRCKPVRLCHGCAYGRMEKARLPYGHRTDRSCGSETANQWLWPIGAVHGDRVALKPRGVQQLPLFETIW